MIIFIRITDLGEKNMKRTRVYILAIMLILLLMEQVIQVGKVLELEIRARGLILREVEQGMEGMDQLRKMVQQIMALQVVEESTVMFLNQLILEVEVEMVERMEVGRLRLL